MGPDHPETLICMNNLAMAYTTAPEGRTRPCRSWRKHEVQRAKLKAGHRVTHTTMASLGYVLQVVGRIDEALPLFQEAVQSSKESLGADHPMTLQSMNDLATGYRVAGKPDLALPLYEETLRLQKSKLGADHPSTLTTHVQPGERLPSRRTAEKGCAST